MYYSPDIDNDRTINLMDIPSSKLTSKVAVMFHKNYIARLVCRNDLHLVPKYVGITTMDALVAWVKCREYKITDLDNLKMWISCGYTNWKSGIKRRRDMADEFGLQVMNAVGELLDECLDNGVEYFKETKEFIKTVNIDELREMLKNDAEYTPLDDEEEEETEKDDDDDKETRHRKLETIESMCKKHTQKAEKIHQTRAEKDAKMEAKLIAEMEKAQKKLDKLKNKNKTKEDKDESKQIEGKIFCLCGGYYDATNKSHHEKTKKHIDWERANGGEVG
jgi:hypothetical protein